MDNSFGSSFNTSCDNDTITILDNEYGYKDYNKTTENNNKITPLYYRDSTNDREPIKENIKPEITTIKTH